MTIIGGYQDTRNNKEDFALTPYFFSVYVWEEVKVLGIGICWGFWCIHIGLAFNLPKGVKRFLIENYKNK